MSELGVIALKFNNNSQSLRKFDEALRFFRNYQSVKRDDKTDEHINRLLKVVAPIASTIRQRLSNSLDISDQSVAKIIRSHHEKDWEGYKSRILDFESKLNSPEFQITAQDFDLLNDIADALDAECTELFRRMGEGR